MAASSESEVLAQELSHMAGKVGALEARLKDIEAVINRLEGAAETTARALEEVSAHWDAVYRAMRRAEEHARTSAFAADPESPPPRAPFAVARLVLLSQRDADSARQFPLGAAFGDSPVLAGFCGLTHLLLLSIRAEAPDGCSWHSGPVWQSERNVRSLDGFRARSMRSTSIHQFVLRVTKPRRAARRREPLSPPSSCAVSETGR